MASTTMTSSNSLTLKRWEMETWLQAMQNSVVGHLFNRGAVYYAEELTKANKGDQTTFSYAGKLTNVPIGEGGTLDGNEEALDLNSHSMAINVCRLGVLNPNDSTIEQQRTNVNFAETARKQLARRAVELLDASALYQLAGANPTTLTLNGTTYNSSNITFVQGLNSVVAPTSERIIRAGGAASDQALTSSDKMSLDLIDYALEQISRSDQPIDMLDGNTFDLFLSPEQMVDLMHDSSTKIQWSGVELAKVAAGGDNMLEERFSNNLVCAGKHRNVYIYEAPRTAYGVNGSTGAVIPTVRRAVLVGRDALSFASPFGGRVTDADVPIKYFAQLKDYEYYKGIEARMVYGMKKMSPSNEQDIGSFVISTYAASHS